MEAEAFSWRVVVIHDDVLDILIGVTVERCFSGQVWPEPADGVFDAALLPGGVGIAEICFQAEFISGHRMLCELASVVEGDGLSGLFGQWGKKLDDTACDGFRSLVGQSCDQGEAGFALVQNQQCLFLVGKAHQVAFPVSNIFASVYVRGTVMDGYAVRDVTDMGARSGPPSALCFAIAEIAVQAVFAALTAVDEAIDGLVGDDPASVFPLKLASDNLGRPSHRKAVAYGLAELA